MSSVFPFARFTVPPVKDQIRLVREEIMGYVRKIPRRTPFVDDLIVFGIFLAVCSPPQQGSSSLKGSYRTGTCRWGIRSGCFIVSVIAICPCHTRSSFANIGVVNFNTTFHQRVSNVVDRGV